LVGIVVGCLGAPCVPLAAKHMGPRRSAAALLWLLLVARLGIEGRFFALS
jgi:hypothetical protein